MGSGHDTIDAGRAVDWGRTSSDYALHRPGPPEGFYTRLQALEIGRPGQRVLDLATGTGVLARAFAAQGARVTGIDIASNQLRQAADLARRQGLRLPLAVARAEALPFAPASFDAATANQCWLYFNAPRALESLRRVLAPGGRLCVSHFNWLPRHDPVAGATEALILKHNPDWSSADFSGAVPPVPPWAAERLVLQGFFWFDHPVPFTHESWRGRIRASRGIGATLSPEAIAAFDAEHAALLRDLVPERFTVLHRLDARVFVFREDA